jgi:phosphatidate phosphatase APP1
MSEQKRKFREWMLNRLHITRRPVVRVYNGYGDEDLVLIYGHVLRQSPLPKRKFKKNFWSNTMSMLRLFMVEPFKDVKVKMQWGSEWLEASTDADGFFKFESVFPTELQPGWHTVTVEVTSTKYAGLRGEGKVLVPFTTQYAFISDVDDTFLISHSSNLRKRLYVLFTKNARTRRPFEGVVRHYQLLAHANTTPENPNPFFYVSSSEWNLYDYIKEFKNSYGLPEGVYLLSQMKQWYEFFKTGQTKHSGKFVRITRVMKEFPTQKFILLGDDTQHDPEIYHKIVEGFPGRILCVYLRHVGRRQKPDVERHAAEMRKLGVEVCYFTKSEEAIEHSEKIGLVNIT